MAVGVDLAVNAFGINGAVMRTQFQGRIGRNRDGDVRSAGRMVLDGDGVVLFLDYQAAVGDVDAVHAIRHAPAAVAGTAVAGFDDHLLAVVGLHRDGAVIA